MSRRDVPRRSARRGVPALLVGLVVASASACANGPGPATPGPTPVAPMPSVAAAAVPANLHLTGEEISIEFDPASERALDDTQTEWRAEEPTLGQLPGWSDGRDTVHLPVTDGDVVLSATPPRGHVVTAGEPMLSRSGSSITFRDLVVDLDGSHVRGTVDGRPLDVFDLDLSRAHVEDPSTLPPMIVDVSGRLSPDAVREVADHLGPGLTADHTSVDIEMRLRSS
jgi:hypothetical protein